MPWGKLNSLSLSAILRDFQRQEYRLTIQEVPKTTGRKTRKREEEHKQLQSIMHFTQAQ